MAESNVNSEGDREKQSTGYRGKLDGNNKEFVNSLYKLYRMRHHPDSMKTSNPFDKKVNALIQNVHPAGGAFPENRMNIIKGQGKELAITIKNQLIELYEERGAVARESAISAKQLADGELISLIKVSLRYCKMKYGNKFQKDTWSKILKELDLPSTPDVSVTKKRDKRKRKRSENNETLKSGNKRQKDKQSTIPKDLESKITPPSEKTLTREEVGTMVNDLLEKQRALDREERRKEMSEIKELLQMMMVSNRKTPIEDQALPFGPGDITTELDSPVVESIKTRLTTKGNSMSTPIGTLEQKDDEDIPINPSQKQISQRSGRRGRPKASNR